MQRRAGCAARGWRRRRTRARARARPRAGRASAFRVSPRRRSSSWAPGTGSRWPGSAAEISAARRRIASTGRSAAPTVHVRGQRREQERDRPPDQEQRRSRLRERFVAVAERGADDRRSAWRPSNANGRGEEALGLGARAATRGARRGRCRRAWPRRPRRAASTGRPRGLRPVDGRVEEPPVRREDLGEARSAGSRAALSAASPRPSSSLTRIARDQLLAARLEVLVDRVVEVVLEAQVEEEPGRRRARSP